MNRSCALDASAALSLLVVGQTTDTAQAFFLEPTYEWRAPDLLRLEVRDAIHRLERRDAVSVGSIDERLALIESEIRFDETNDATMLSNIVTRARRASLSVYDITHLETTIRRDAAIASRDTALLRASAAANVETFDLR